MAPRLPSLKLYSFFIDYLCAKLPLLAGLECVGSILAFVELNLE
ncbi:hypothetical protein PDR5_19350 [Pseudomonas sp. DR 5-09]|nr:hypothetical protein PDR5_19350 [Pseudomonas sp. DR 5-09]